MSQEPLAEFWISGPPVGRAVKPIKLHSGFASVALTGPALKYQRHVRAKIRHVWGDREPIPAPVALHMVAYLPMPQSWSGKKKRELRGTLAPSKPDMTNIFKLAEDAVVGSKNERLVLVDDAKVVQLYGEKRYAGREDAGLLIRVFAVVASHSQRDIRHLSLERTEPLDHL